MTARHSIPPVDDPEVIRRVVAILTAHRPGRIVSQNVLAGCGDGVPAKATRPNPARGAGLLRLSGHVATGGAPEPKAVAA